MKKRATAAAVLLRAAEMIDSGKEACGCWAIAKAFLNHNYYEERYIARQAFEMLRPPARKNYWFGSCDVKENQQRRVLALLFARELVLRGMYE